MANKNIKVKGVTSCSGAFGSLQADEVRDLEAGVAESLILGGLAVQVDAVGKPLAEDEKKQVSPTPKETPENESSSSLPAPKTESAPKPKSRSSGKSMNTQNTLTGSSRKTTRS